VALFNVIPAGEKALVTSSGGVRTVVTGPKRVWRGSNVQMFRREVIPQNSRGTLVDENGKFSSVQGPSVVHIHPDGHFIPDLMRNLASHEAMVVIDRNGKYRIETGDKTPTVWVTMEEQIHEFKWTGSRGDTEVKTPGALRINCLRMQDTQTYVEYQVRTKDNIVAAINLMISFKFVDIEKLLANDDPMGAMYNRILADITKHVATLSFDDFKEDTEAKVTGIDLFTDTGRKWFDNLGISLETVVLRAWRPLDVNVQRILEQAATANAQKAVDAANHERKMTQLQNEDAILDREASLDAKRREAAVARGQASGAELVAMFDALTLAPSKISMETGERLLALTLASKAETLCLPPEMLGKTR